MSPADILVLCTEPFSYDDSNGLMIVVAEGDVFRGSSPVVRGHEACFDPLVLILGHSDESAGACMVQTVGSKGQSGYQMWRKLRTATTGIRIRD